MSIESSQNNPAISEAAVNQAAEAMIQKNCNIHGIIREQFPADGVEEAHRIVRQELEADAALKANPLYARLQASEEANRLAQMQLQAMSQTRIAPNNNVKPVADVARVRGLLGESAWFALTDSGRLASCGIPPASVTALDLQEATKLFGRGANSQYANNAFKQDAGRYRHLKNIAIIKNIQGN